MTVIRQLTTMVSGILLLGAGACATPAPPTALAPADAARSALEAQARLWNEGDLESALSAYCPSADITWVNKSGLTTGYEAFAASMHEGFPGPETMGTLTNTVLGARDLGHGQSLVSLRWSITQGETTLMGGVSSQLWADCDGTLRIVFEHAS
jgi:hypothetical protein